MKQAIYGRPTVTITVSVHCPRCSYITTYSSKDDVPEDWHCPSCQFPRAPHPGWHLRRDESDPDVEMGS